MPLGTLMLLEAATFLVAASVHSGFFIPGQEHREARIAETVIAGVLVAGGLMALGNPAWARRAALAAQGFALVGTIVGMTMILIGIGPQGALELVYHVTIAAVLVFGLVTAARQRRVA